MSVTISPFDPERPRRTHSVRSANWTNVNTRGIFRLVSMPGAEDDGLCGGIAPAQIPDVLRATIGALNSETRRAHLVRPPVTVDGGGVHARMFIPGTEDGQVMRRLTQLRDILVYAQQNNLHVVWS